MKLELIAHEKLDKLREIIQGYGSVAVAFSGGVDSTFLLKVAAETLGDKAIAVTARSSTYPERELLAAQAFAKDLGVRHILIYAEELDIPNFKENSPDRCYYCKNELFQKIKEAAQGLGIQAVAEGSNADDTKDYRPGMKAVRELKIKSPLLDAGLTKEQIRALSREMGLNTWDKQPFACIASRFPYGQPITREKLLMVDRAEQFLLDLGFRQMRVRHHGDIARIEVDAQEMGRFFSGDLAQKVYAEFKKIGFTYITLDLAGYRTGSMNETLAQKGGREERNE